MGFSRHGGSSVERSTTGWKQGYGADNGLDGTAVGGTCRHGLDGTIDIAKVGVAGSNPVVRSTNRLVGAPERCPFAVAGAIDQQPATMACGVL